MAPGPASYVGLPGDAEEEKTFSQQLEMCVPETRLNHGKWSSTPWPGLWGRCLGRGRLGLG